jgi:hypothetical protein
MFQQSKVILKIEDSPVYFKLILFKKGGIRKMYFDDGT